MYYFHVTHSLHAGFVRVSNVCLVSSDICSKYIASIEVSINSQLVQICSTLLPSTFM